MQFRTIIATCAAAAALLLGCGTAEHAHHGRAPAPGEKATITGEVVDTACWIGHDTKGSDHAKCAEMCAKAGIPLAILDTAADVMYLPISLDHSNPNAKLLPFLDRKVRVTGTVMEKSGMKGIAIDQIEEAS